MPGGKIAVPEGRRLVDRVAALAEELGLTVRREVKVGRRLWGAVRRIDLVLEEPGTRRRLGLECKAQGTSGSAEEKIPATIQDITAWPIQGLVVFEGAGFSDNMRAFLYSTGKAVELEDLRDWLLLYFAIEEPAAQASLALPPTAR